MANNTVELQISSPTIRIVLTPALQEIWNRIQFHEESKQYDQYDAAWEEFLDMTHEDIIDQFSDEFYVMDAREYRGA